jgi:hypothetical protein
MASSFEPTLTETPIEKNDELNEKPNRPDGMKGGAKLGNKTELDTRQVQDQDQFNDQNLPRSPFIPILVLHILEETLNTAVPYPLDSM